MDVLTIVDLQSYLGIDDIVVRECDHKNSGREFGDRITKNYHPSFDNCSITTTTVQLTKNSYPSKLPVLRNGDDKSAVVNSILDKLL